MKNEWEWPEKTVFFNFLVTFLLLLVSYKFAFLQPGYVCQRVSSQVNIYVLYRELEAVD